ncbi:MAG: hypothetical protein HY726_11180 [Candidatus Rokubacteria bacterium]|nr:hypothetical protein [Candidatus Rokubacteria bacterium]
MAQEQGGGAPQRTRAKPWARAGKTGHVVTVEDHTVRGGLGGAVAELLSELHPTPRSVSE